LEGNTLIVWTTNAISFWDDFLDPLKVTFDGANKLIRVNPQYNTLALKKDVYSASKRWMQRRTNYAYLPPLKSIGGDPITASTYAGDIYFLIYGWQIYIDHQVTLTGSLFNSNLSQSPYVVTSGGGIIATVSSQAFAYNTTGVTVPSATDVASAVWNSNPSQYAAGTTAGTINSINSTVTNVAVTTNNIFAVSV